MQGRCISCLYSEEIKPFKTVVRCSLMVILVSLKTAHLLEGKEVPYSMQETLKGLVVSPYFGCCNYQRIYGENNEK